MSEKRSIAEMVGSSVRTAALVVAVVGIIRALGSQGERSVKSVVVVLAVGVALYAVGVVIERWR
jgi:hypothetical protein